MNNKYDFDNIEYFKIKRDKDIFVIYWKLTDFCNYNCSYCIQGNSHNKVKPDLDKIKHIANKLNLLIDNYKKSVKLMLIGGEIFVIDIESLFKEQLTSIYIKNIHFTSNFSRSSDYFNSLANYFDNRGISYRFVFSFHEEFTTKEIFFNKIKELTFNNFTVEMVVTKDNIELVKEVKDLTQKLNIPIMFDVDRKNSNFEFPFDLYSNSEIIRFISCKFFGQNKEIDIDANFIRKNINFTGYNKVICSTKEFLFINKNGFISANLCGDSYLSHIDELPQNISLAEINNKEFLCDKKRCSFCTKAIIKPIYD